MAKTKQVYVAGDGKQFETKAEADRHNELTDAIEELHSAGRKVREALLNTGYTADGQPFDSRRTDYYWIRGAWSTSPVTERLYIWPWQMSVDIDSAGRLFLRHWDGTQCSTYCTDDLYATRKAADEAVAKLLAARIEEMQAFIEGVRTRIGS